jgi:hypothetical protein
MKSGFSKLPRNLALIWNTNRLFFAGRRFIWRFFLCKKHLNIFCKGYAASIGGLRSKRIRGDQISTNVEIWSPRNF